MPFQDQDQQIQLNVDGYSNLQRGRLEKSNKINFYNIKKKNFKPAPMV